MSEVRPREQPGSPASTKRKEANRLSLTKLAGEAMERIGRATGSPTRIETKVGILSPVDKGTDDPDSKKQRMDQQSENASPTESVPSVGLSSPETEYSASTIELDSLGKRTSLSHLTSSRPKASGRGRPAKSSNRLSSQAQEENTEESKQELNSGSDSKQERRKSLIPKNAFKLPGMGADLLEVSNVRNKLKSTSGVNIDQNEIRDKQQDPGSNLLQFRSVQALSSKSYKDSDLMSERNLAQPAITETADTQETTKEDSKHKVQKVQNPSVSTDVEEPKGEAKETQKSQSPDKKPDIKVDVNNDRSKSPMSPLSPAVRGLDLKRSGSVANKKQAFEKGSSESSLQSPSSELPAAVKKNLAQLERVASVSKKRHLFEKADSNNIEAAESPNSKLSGNPTVESAMKKGMLADVKRSASVSKKKQIFEKGQISSTVEPSAKPSSPLKESPLKSASTTEKAGSSGDNVPKPTVRQNSTDTSDSDNGKPQSTMAFKKVAPSSKLADRMKVYETPVSKEIPPASSLSRPTDTASKKSGGIRSKALSSSSTSMKSEEKTGNRISSIGAKFEAAASTKGVEDYGSARFKLKSVSRKDIAEPRNDPPKQQENAFGTVKLKSSGLSNLIKEDQRSDRVSTPVKEEEPPASLSKYGKNGSKSNVVLSQGSTASIDNLASGRLSGKSSLEVLNKPAEDIGAVKGMLKSVQPGAKSTGSASTKLEIKTQPQTSGSDVPEFLSFRTKLRSVKEHPTSTPSSPTKTDAADLSLQRKSLPAQSVASDKVAFNVQLRSAEKDKFLSAAGGSVLPTEPLLYVLKGKRRAILQRVPLSLESLNQTDCFILDVPAKPSNDPEKLNTRPMFVCAGSNCSRVRRTRAVEIANLMKDFDYSQKASILLIDIGDLNTRSIPEQEKLFWKCVLGDSKSPTSVFKNIPKVPATTDEEFDESTASTLSLYRFTNDKEKETVAIGAKNLARTALDTTATLVLDCGNEVYAWAGKTASDKVREAALKCAEELKQKNNAYLFLEGEKFERVSFKLKFEDWKPGKELGVYNVLEVKQAGNIKAKDKEWRVYERGSDVKKVDKIDIISMYDKNSSREANVAKNTETVDMDPAELINRDWGFVNLRVWRIADTAGSHDKNSKVQISKESIQKYEIRFSENDPLKLFSKDCYVFLYEYKEKPPKFNDVVLAERTKVTKEELKSQMKDVAVLYMWIGNESAIADQVVLPHFVLELEKDVTLTNGGPLKAKHVRLIEGKEPTHFLNVIRGGNIPRDQPQKFLDMMPKADVTPSEVVVYRRGKRVPHSDTTDKLTMYHVFGVTQDDVRVTEMTAPSIKFLFTAHCYVLHSGKEAFVWFGKGAFQWECTTALHFAHDILKGTKVIEIVEGKEPSTFWSLFSSSLPKDRPDDMEWNRRRELPVGWKNVLSMGSTQGHDLFAPYDCRLWKIGYFLNGNPTASEIAPFTQYDLEEDGVYILDTYFRVFVWIGAVTARNRNLLDEEVDENSVMNKFMAEEQESKSAAAQFKEITLALETVTNYVEFVREREDSRLTKEDVFIQQSGFESDLFKCHFGNWRELHRVNPEKWPSDISLQETLDLFYKKKYSKEFLKELARTRKNIPFGIDLENLEQYLSFEEFKIELGIDPESFNGQPGWKKATAKRRSGLF